MPQDGRPQAEALITMSTSEIWVTRVEPWVRIMEQFFFLQILPCNPVACCPLPFLLPPPTPPTLRC